MTTDNWRSSKVKDELASCTTVLRASMVVGEFKLADDPQELYKISFKHLAAHAQHAFPLYTSFINLRFAFSSHFLVCAWRAFDSIKHLFNFCVDLLNDSAVFLALSCYNSMFIVSVEDSGGVSSLVKCYVSSTCRPVLCSWVVSFKDIPLVQVLISL